jgi:transmembrane protein 231
MLKQSWVQFLCIFFVLHWALAWFERQVFRHRIVETRLLSDIQPKQQRF